jgi:N-acetylmuramoyl-L-alanine amidase
MHLTRRQSLQKLISGLAMSLIFFLFFCNHSFAQSRIKTIVIDAGHGGMFPGARGKYSSEKDVTLKVALSLGKAIEDSMKDVKVIYTRTTDMHFDKVISKDLRERINIANRAKADLLVSIHCNAAGGGQSRSAVKGVETFVTNYARLKEQNAALKQYSALEEEYKLDEVEEDDPAATILLTMMRNTLRQQSIKLATLIQDEYIAAGRVNRGVQELSLAVLRIATMPAVLNEIGFLTNPEEESYMNSEEGRNEIVNCLLKGIQAYKKQAELE